MGVNRAFSNGPAGLTLKAWVHFQSTAVNGAQVIAASGNVASVNRTATGTYTVTFTSALASTKYVIRASGDAGQSTAKGGGAVANTTAANRLVGSCVVEAQGAALGTPLDFLGGIHLEFWE